MAMPASVFELELPVESRVARLEANVEHIRSDIADIKVDLRRLNDKVDGVEQRLSVKIDDVDNRLCVKIDEVDNRLSGKIDEVDKRLSGKIDDVDKRLSGKIDDVDKRLCGKIDDVDKRLCGKIESVKDMVTSLALTVEKGFAAQKVGRAFDRIWYLLTAAALLGVMARGFKWI
jgi:chromosome segregation ATPase